MIRRLTRLLLGSTFCLLIALFAIYALLASETGTRWIIGGLQRVMPGEIHVTGINGNLMGNLQLKHFRYRLPPHSLEIDSLALSWHPADLLQRRLEVTDLSAKGIRYRGPETFTDDEESNEGTSLTPPIGINLVRARLDDIEITIGEDTYRIRNVELSAGSGRDTLRIRTLKVRTDQAAATFEASADLPSMTNINGTVTWHAETKELGKLFGEGRIRGNLSALTLEHGLSAPFFLHTHGTVNLDSTEPLLDVQGDWRGLRWPPEGNAEVLSENGKYHIAGTPDAYRVDLTGQISGPQIPAATIELTGAGSASRFDIQRFTANALAASVHASGDITWQDATAFNLTADGNNMRLQDLLPDWPGAISFNTHIDGRLVDGIFNVSAEIRKLEGNLRGYPVAATGTVRIEGEKLAAEKLVISSGANQISLDGTIEQTLAVTFNVDAPKLAEVWPGLDGSLKSRGRVAGSRESPTVDATFNAKRLQFQDYSAKAIDLIVRLDARREGMLNVQLDGEQLNAAGRTIQSLTLSAEGTVGDHRLDTAVKSTAASLEMSLTGGYKAGRWTGKAEELTLSSEAMGLWRLRGTSPLSLASLSEKPSVNLETLCLHQNNAQICGKGEWKQGAGFSASGTLNDLPLSLAAAYLPEQLSLEGLIDARFQATQNNDRTTASADIAPQPGRIVIDDEAGPFTVAYSGAHANMELKNGVTRLTYALNLDGLGSSDGTIRVDPDERLSGSLRAVFTDLSPVAALVPEVGSFKGTLSANAEIGGRLNDPSVQANLDLRDAKANIPGLGLDLREIELTACSRNKSTLLLRGGARSGNGRLDIKGEAILDPARGWPVRFAVKGDRFQVARLPEAQVEVSPNLDIAVQNGNTEVTGTLLVPKMKIELKELPRSAVTVSEDEIIEGETPALVADGQHAAPTRLDARIEIQLGEDVFFKGYGLKTKLAGTVEVSSRAGKTRAQGEINLKKGHYRSYGQDLTIERGRFLFTGPVDNPDIDIRATRTSKTDQVTAVLSVTGPLKKPKTTVFSEPPLPAKEALAYLLTGRPLNRANKSQQAMLAQAALGYGLEQAQVFTQRIGLDELDVESDGSLEGSSVILGKYLSPDLYMGYVTNLFAGGSAVTLRYRITKHLSAETRAGTTQSVDLLYNIEVE
ncbi:MAG: translocation/assembly module TamB domain-containing protein [Pseudomonadota bacterium]